MALGRGSKISRKQDFAHISLLLSDTFNSCSRRQLSKCVLRKQWDRWLLLLENIEVSDPFSQNIAWHRKRARWRKYSSLFVWCIQTLCVCSVSSFVIMCRVCIWWLQLDPCIFQINARLFLAENKFIFVGWRDRRIYKSNHHSDNHNRLVHHQIDSFYTIIFTDERRNKNGQKEHLGFDDGRCILCKSVFQCTNAGTNALIFSLSECDIIYPSALMLSRIMTSHDPQSV